MDLFERRLDAVMRAGVMELPLAVREFAEIAASIIRDFHNRIAALESSLDLNADGRVM